MSITTLKKCLHIASFATHTVSAALYSHRSIDAASGLHQPAAIIIHPKASPLLAKQHQQT